MKKYIDLRSDTVTLPTPAMRAAMAQAELGDDVYGEDPTVNRLEQMAAERMGKEAGLFVASGTMGNLVAVLTHCGRGDEVIMGKLGHTFLFEAGGVAALGGVHPHTLPNQPDGSILLEDIRAAVRADNPHFPVSRLVILENTHNRCGGAPLTAEYTRQVASLAGEYGMKLHLDGARIFNAAVALGVSAADLAAPADSVTFCLSKGLCAPVGSVLCGEGGFIAKARRLRKMLGGGMRQAGVLAAAGVVALEEMVDRLAEDHRRARQLASKLAQIPGVSLKHVMPPSNMVFVNLDEQIPMTADQLANRLKNDFQVLVGVVSQKQLRLVTHYWIDDEAVERAVLAFERAL
ncbi:MAG: low-specificity L-threonine aldolase [Anaerolineae bacterium]|nr:low-specificity L-threonine aldolase [Anaerolineae bacterium]